MISLDTPCPIIFKMNIMPILSNLKSDFLQYRVIFHSGPAALREKKTLYCKKSDFKMDNIDTLFSKRRLAFLVLNPTYLIGSRQTLSYKEDINITSGRDWL